MHHNQPRIRLGRNSSSSRRRNAEEAVQASKNQRITGDGEKESSKTYSAVAAGLNRELGDKANNSNHYRSVQLGHMGKASDKTSSQLARMDGSRSSKKSSQRDGELEVIYEQVQIPETCKDANKTVSTANSASQIQTGEISANNIVLLAPSIDRPGWVLTSDEFMVLEFGSADSITLRRDAPS